jgi:hypothetical protein
MVSSVNHPDHYNHIPGIECIDVIEWMTYNAGAAVKYLWRHGHKNGADAITDLRKAIWYIEREIRRLERERENGEAVYDPPGRLG